MYITCLLLILLFPELRAQTAFYWAQVSNSIAMNDSIELSYSIQDKEIIDNNSGHTYNAPLFFVKIRNKTDKTLFVDLGNTFLIHNEEAECYYIPSSTSSTSGRAGGGSVNLGAIGGAIGIGGAVGTVLSGVNAGGGTSSSTSSTTYAQRVVAIPPMSSKSLSGMFLFPNSNVYPGIIQTRTSKRGTYPYLSFGKSRIARLKIEEGKTQTYTPEESPIRFSSYLTYSFSENCDMVSHIRSDFYVNRVVCYKPIWSNRSFNEKKMLKVFPDWREWGDTYFFIVHNRF